MLAAVLHAQLGARLVQVARDAEAAEVARGERGEDAEGVRGAQVVAVLVARARVQHGRHALHRTVVLERDDEHARVQLGHLDRLGVDATRRLLLGARRGGSGRSVTLMKKIMLLTRNYTARMTFQLNLSR